MNDFPGISAKSILEKGTAPGTTRVIIDAQEGPFFNGALSVNNFGNRYTGAVQVVAQAAASDIRRRGDQLSLILTSAERLRSGDLSYSLPLGSTGLKADLSYTGLRYELGKEFKSLNAEGTANTLAAQLSYPLVRTRVFSLWQGVTYQYCNLEDEIGGIDTSDRTLNVVSTSTTIHACDRFGSGGLSSVFVQLSKGDLDLGIAAEATTDAGTANAEGHFLKLNY